MNTLLALPSEMCGLCPFTVPKQTTFLMNYSLGQPQLLPVRIIFIIQYHSACGFTCGLLSSESWQQGEPIPLSPVVALGWWSTSAGGPVPALCCDPEEFSPALLPGADLPRGREPLKQDVSLTDHQITTSC